MLWLTALVLAFFLAIDADAVTPEYLTNEDVIDISGEDFETPLDGLSRDDDVIVEGVSFGQSVGSYLPGLEKWFSEAVFTFAPRSYYFKRTDGDDVREEAAIGGTASFVTGWWRDWIRLGVSGSLSQALYAPAGREGTGILRSNGDSYATRGEGYVEMKWNDVLVVKGPWQEMDLPFFNTNDSRMTPIIHEAALITVERSPNWFAGVGHVTRMKRRNETTFRSLSDIAGALGTNKGATLAGFLYEWREEASNIGVLNAYGWDTFNTFYAETNHDFDLGSELELNASAQFVSQRSVGREYLGPIDSESVGLQVALDYHGVVGTIGLTDVGAGGRIRDPWGGTPLYNSSMISDFDRAGEEALQFGLSSSLESIGLPWVRLLACYTHGDTPDSGAIASSDQDEVNFTVDIKPEKGQWDGFWLRFRNAWNDGLRGVDHENLRVILNYSKDF